MTDPYQVPSSERGVVRLFTSDHDAEGNSAITPQNVQKLLGDGLDLDPSRVEVFPSTVLEAMGLAAYLREGYGIPEEDLSRTAAALDAMKGLVILVASAAFRGEAVTLDPKPGIRFVGAFSEPSMAPPEKMAPTSAAEGVLSPEAVSAPTEVRRGSSWPLILLALIAAAGLVLFLVI